MQTKLCAILLTVGLLWTSLMSAATHKAKAQNLNSAAKYVGIASWYGKHHQGRKMANGKPFDRHKLTAACWFLPLGSEVRVKNLANGREVTVLVTDRGPATRLRRIIDLSEEAANQLDFVMAGTTFVFLQPFQQVEPTQVQLDDSLIASSEVAYRIE